MKVLDLIFSKVFHKFVQSFTLADLPEDILPTDKIQFIKDEGHDSENESWDPYCELRVYREREETEEEKQKRLKEIKDLVEASRKKRYETFLKLKKEFEQ